MKVDSAQLRRLLNLYPLEAIKKKWAPDGKHTKQDLITLVVAKETREEIRNFAKTAFGFTKQNVVIFDVSKLKKLPETLLDDAESLSTTAERAAGTYFYLVPLVHTVFVRAAGEPGEEQEVLFKWPVYVTIVKNRATVRCTIMEKDIESYFDDGMIVYPVKRSLDEETLVESIRQELNPSGSCERCDLNKGIKALWKDDRIDARSTKYKTSNSTDSTSMDGKFMLKRDRPDVYAKLVQAPLLKTAFYLLKKDEKQLDHFWSDPTAGELGFSTFSPSETFITDVIGEILKHN